MTRELLVIEYSSTINFCVTDHLVHLLLVTPLLLEKLMVEERPIILSLRVCHDGSVLVLVVKVARQSCSYLFWKSSILYPGY